MYRIVHCERRQFISDISFWPCPPSLNHARIHVQKKSHDNWKALNGRMFFSNLHFELNSSTWSDTIRTVGQCWKNMFNIRSTTVSMTSMRTWRCWKCINSIRVIFMGIASQTFFSWQWPICRKRIFCSASIYSIRKRSVGRKWHSSPEEHVCFHFTSAKRIIVLWKPCNSPTCWNLADFKNFGSVLKWLISPTDLVCVCSRTDWNAVQRRFPALKIAFAIVSEEWSILCWCWFESFAVICQTINRTYQTINRQELQSALGRLSSKELRP